MVALDGDDDGEFLVVGGLSRSGFPSARVFIHRDNEWAEMEHMERVRSGEKSNLAGLGSILDTLSEDTEDTAYLYLFNVSGIHFQAILLMVSVSEVS